MRIPDPKANTTTEAYLAYKAGYLEESELKPVLYEPYLHFDGWLAYWAGLTNEYPFNASEKNVLQLKKYSASGIDVKLAAGGMISVSGTTQNNYANFMTYQTPIDLKAGVYTLSRVGDKTYAVSLTVYNENKTQYTSINIAAGNSSTTANIDFDIKYIAGAFIGLTVGSNLDFVAGLQLEAGSEASEFETSTIPEMLCDEEALVAYLSGVTDTYPEDIKDPYDVRIVGYLKHLVSARWPEPDYPVNNEEFYLSTMEPTHTSNPMPSSDIELDTAEGKIISVEAYGDTYQQTYSGANLYDYSDTKSVSTGVTADSDGWITATYDNTGSSAVYLQYFTDLLELANSTDYAIVLEVKSVTGTGGIDVCTSYQGQFTSSDNYLFSQLENGKTYIRTKTTKASFDDAIYSLRTVINFASGQSGSITFRVSVLADTSVAPGTFVYQPYVGGVPAPNPDYPQEIHTVTGEQTVDVHGKNLGGFVGAGTQAGVTATSNSDGSITVNGTAASTTPYISARFNATIPAGTYTISVGTVNDFNIRLAGVYEDSSSRVGIAIIPAGSTSATFTISKALIGVDLWFNATIGTSYNFTVYPMLEEGSTATAYEPYQGQSYHISLGSTELCKIGDYQDYIYKGGDDWYVHKETSKVALDGSEGYALLQIGSTGKYYYRMYPSAPDWGQQTTDGRLFFSDYFRPTNAWNEQVVGAWLDINLILKTKGSLDNTESVQDLENWLSNSKPIFYFALATPTDTKITDATLVGQLEALAGADTYNGKTYIKVTANDPDLPALLKVEAYKY